MTAFDERTYKVFKGSDDFNYRGVQADLRIPFDLKVEQDYDYSNWYIGFTDIFGNQVETGISYSKKYSQARPKSVFSTPTALTLTMRFYSISRFAVMFLICVSSITARDRWPFTSIASW